MDNNIHNQDRHYRRGLVLGLTMAEIMTLIIFVLLLAFASSILVQEKRIQELEAQLAALQPILNQAGSQSIEDILKEYVRQKERIAQLEKQLNDAQAKIDAGEKVLNALARLPPSSSLHTPDDVVDAINKIDQSAKAGQLVKENADLRAQVTNLSKQLGNGRGLVYPPCWADEKGNIEYIFDTYLMDSGSIVVHNNALQNRAADQAKLPLQNARYDTPLMRSDFRNVFLPLYVWSTKQDPVCRFFVRVHDKTAESNKPTYKVSLQAVEDLFYKLQVE